MENIEKYLHFLKQVSVNEALDDGAPNGVDCFFDNVGGENSAIIINRLNDFGRVSCCGAISNYNNAELPRVPTTSESIVFKVCITWNVCK